MWALLFATVAVLSLGLSLTAIAMQANDGAIE